MGSTLMQYPLTWPWREWRCDQCNAAWLFDQSCLTEECECGGSYRRPGPEDIPNALLREAQACEPIRGRVRRGVDRYAIRSQAGAIVGFVCPHPRADGWWRLGPIFVSPSARGRGLATEAVRRFRFLGLRHYVPDTAPESLRMHRAAGFTVEREMKRGTVLVLPAVDLPRGP